MNKYKYNYIQKFNKDKYIYYRLIQEDDVFVRSIKSLDLSEINLSHLMKLSLYNALKEGGKRASNTNTSNAYFINDKYGNNVKVSREGLTHSKRKILNSKRNLIINFSTVFKTSVKVNEAYKEGMYSSIYFSEYIYDGMPYIARFIVTNDNINNIDVFSLYALGTNKKEINAMASMSLQPISKISIKQLLTDVNTIADYKNSLPLDVLFKLNGKNYHIKHTDIVGLKY